MIIKQEYPDITLQSDKPYNDELDITIRNKEVEFCAKVDGCGNNFVIDKNELINLLHKPVKRSKK